jgi:hypothetical protein
MSRKPNRDTIDDAGATVFDLESICPTPTAPSSELATCVGEEHPVLAGRALCRFDRGGAPIEAWLACLWHVRPRAGDRVLVLRPSDSVEPIVVGVVDGFRARLAPDARAAHVRRLAEDESVRIEGPDGRALLEIRASSDDGCVVRFLTGDAALVAEGTLRLEGDAVAVRARRGEVAVSASDDVVVQGEQIHLN